MTLIELITKILKSGTNAAMPKLYKTDHLHSTETIRAYLEQFRGGSVDLICEPDGIATITLNNPDKRNAISGKMMGDFYDAVEKLENWKEGKGVILCGKDQNFCSGGDLDMARGTGNADGGFMMTQFMCEILDRLQVLPFVTVALIEGCGALGGGSEITMACDFRLMSEQCKGLGFVHGRMGLVPAWGGMRRLVKVVGYQKALKILTAAKVCRPEEALKLGLIDDIISGETPMDAARTWIKEKISLSPVLIHAIKTATLLASENADKELEQKIFAPFWGCPENQAALSANIKHKPQN